MQVNPRQKHVRILFSGMETRPTVIQEKNKDTNNYNEYYGNLGLNCSTQEYSKYQLSLTNPRDALHHGKRAANKGGRSQ